MAGFEFNAEGVPDPSEITQEELRAAVSAQAEPSKKARLILERYLRDFAKSSEKKKLDITSALKTLDIRQAIRGEDEEEIQRKADQIVEKVKDNYDKLGIQVDKEFDNIFTRLKTQGGKDADFETIQSVKDALDEALEGAKEQAEELGENLKQRSVEKIKKRDAKTKLKQDLEAAQAEAEKAQMDYYEQNQERLQFTPSEIVKAGIDRFFFMGRRGSLFTDTRKQRQAELDREARAAGEQAFRESLEEAGQGPDAGEFAPKRTPKGFRASDIAAPLGKLAAFVTAFKEIDQAISRGIEGVGRSLSEFGEGSYKASTATGLILGKDIPLNVGGRVLTQLVKTTEDLYQSINNQVGMFSGEALSANVNRQIDLLQENIRRADDLGRPLALMTASSTRMEIELRKISDGLFLRFFPVVIGIQNGISSFAEWFTTPSQARNPNDPVAQVLGQLGQALNWFNPLATALKAFADEGRAWIADQEAKEAMKNQNVIQEFNDFIYNQGGSNVPTPIQNRPPLRPR